MSKSHSLRFTRRRNVTRDDFSIDGFTTPCCKSAKLLGAIIDQELRWKEHAEYAASKGTKLVLAISRLTHPTLGMPHKHVRRLYISIALPKNEVRSRNMVRTNQTCPWGFLLVLLSFALLISGRGLSLVNTKKQTPNGKIHPFQDQTFLMPRKKGRNSKRAHTQ